MKTHIVRIASAQINTTVGDLAGNRDKIIQYINFARDKQADIVCFPELAVTGYPPEDLLLKPKFVEDNLNAIEQIAKASQDIISVVGYVDKKDKNLYNAAAVISDGRIKNFYHKILLPNYGVFDEKRYFAAGATQGIFEASGVIFAVNICEDIWHEEGPFLRQVEAGAKLILNINASPYYAGKVSQREKLITGQARSKEAVIVYTNLVGGQDELVFDGQSMVVSQNGSIITRGAAFREELIFTDIEVPVSLENKNKTVIHVASSFVHEEKTELPKKDFESLKPAEEIYKALVLGLKDYVVKNRFKKVVVGLSGGIDSSLVATIAVDALGRDNVTGIFMSSRYSSQESEVDAQLVAKNLGIEFKSISIEHIYKMYLLFFESHFVGLSRDITEENIQARIRGNVLMAFSNKFGWLVLTTGNKSELSTGYATLYGDMAGGFAVIKDVPKTIVYDLVRYRNSLREIIPERVLLKEPTAELRPNQKDSDSLPPYDLLDPILKAYVEEDKSLKEIVDQGFDADVVKKVIELVDKSEYKRRQSPPGIKITPKAFGRDRRMPITNKYKG
jgi:NAD+ synthase (glutamine-hydrolysing)